MLFLATLFLLWPAPDFTASVYSGGHDLGPLTSYASQHYGLDDLCSVSPRPLYSGELEGLPLYEIFDAELADLVGFEFRRPYYRDPPSNFIGCNASGCSRPRSIHWDGFSIGLTERQKILHEILRSE